MQKSRKLVMIRSICLYCPDSCSAGHAFWAVMHLLWFILTVLWGIHVIKWPPWKSNLPHRPHQFACGKMLRKIKNHLLLVESNYCVQIPVNWLSMPSYRYLIHSRCNTHQNMKRCRSNLVINVLSLVSEKRKYL